LEIISAQKRDGRVRAKDENWQEQASLGHAAAWFVSPTAFRSDPVIFRRRRIGGFYWFGVSPLHEAFCFAARMENTFDRAKYACAVIR
jgi:hypothetical protein